MSGSDGQIDYEGFVAEAMRDAMRGVLRRVLIDVAKNGLPGDHHFFISFKTGEPGVSLSSRLLDKYPDEMTIVLQHRFWDMAVHADRFEVKLQFNSIPEKLVIPFAAIRVFVDPSVRFGHQFDDLEAGSAADDAASPAIKGAARSGARSSGATPIARQGRRTATRNKRTDGESPPVVEKSEAFATSSTADASAASVPEVEQTTAKATPIPAEGGANDSKVVSLDKFRKK